MVADQAATTATQRHDHGALAARARDEAELLVDLANRGARILVVTHIDADGLSSGSIAFSALARKNFAASVRAIPDLDPRAIERLKADKFEFYLFTDLGSGLLGELSRRAVALGLRGLREFDLVIGHAGHLERGAHRHRSLLGEFGVLLGIAGGVVEAAHHHTAAGLHVLDDVDQCFVRARGHFGAAAGEVELDHAAF